MEGDPAVPLEKSLCLAAPPSGSLWPNTTSPRPLATIVQFNLRKATNRLEDVKGVSCSNQNQR